MTKQFCLKNPPEDGITSIEYHHKKTNILLASSWDKTIRLYDTNTCEMKTKIDHDSPVLDTCFGSDYQAFSAGLDGSLYGIDLATGKKESIANHELGVRSVCWSSSLHTVYSGSWDKSVRMWDIRAKGHLVGKLSCPQKVYSMDLRDNILAVALSHEKVYIYDVRKMAEPLTISDTQLRYMLKCVRVKPGGQAIACSSVDGRVSLDTFGGGKSERFSFKLHRQTLGDTEVVYPVNSLSFHPIYGTFASGGSDGVVSMWDPDNKRRIKVLSRFTEEISNVAFNSDGRQLAIARSYTFDEGHRPHASDAIYIRHVDENDCKLKPTSASSTTSTSISTTPKTDTL